MKQSTADYLIATTFYNGSIGDVDAIWKLKFGVSLNYQDDFCRKLKQLWYKSSLASDY